MPRSRPSPTRAVPRILRAPARPDITTRELEEYFAGRRYSFDLPPHWRLAGGFRRAMLSHLADIGYRQQHEPAATQPWRPVSLPDR